ncbi:uncharacterized protein LOC126106725 [Schistocerca cancellata]|uniref:uncharacterized protein LOC126106725 n=1 Tax=Schistocerca cancellata TaxID=274614 RepID=UPI002118150B|nr:uncharacterized protein LOC126106725 [Schistocerca cancellata]
MCNGNILFQIPNTANEWKQVAHSFSLLWQFPHCIDAVDGKKVTFRALRAADAYFRDYKGHNSIVLLVVVDAHYRFLYTNIGANGRVNDGAIFNQSKLSEALESNNMNLPPPEKVECFDGPDLPYVFVADDAFALKPYMMKPYPERELSKEQKVFHYRLSRARKVVENAFGIIKTNLEFC